MKKIIVHIKQKSEIAYHIFIGDTIDLNNIDAFEYINYSKVLFVVDEELDKKVISEIQRSVPIAHEVIVLPGRDTQKTIRQVERIWEFLYRHQFDRKSLVINIGGGMICDLGGFAASTYMRGIPFVHMPTTLLSQVDASVGGKTGINFGGGKNIIGTFQQPMAVVIDVSFLDSLPRREFVSGFAEIIKHGLIADRNYFFTVIAKKPELFRKQELREIIEKSCLIKKEVVESDERESGRRKVLNFGHTVGHAIELSGGFLHGEAVSIGMIAEAKIAESMELLSQEDFELIKRSLEKAGLPIGVSGLGRSRVEELIRVDKKNSEGVVRWTLLKGIGEAVWDQRVPEDVVHLGLEAIGIV